MNMIQKVSPSPHNGDTISKLIALSGWKSWIFVITSETAPLVANFAHEHGYDALDLGEYVLHQLGSHSIKQNVFLGSRTRKVAQSVVITDTAIPEIMRNYHERELQKSQNAPKTVQTTQLAAAELAWTLSMARIDYTVAWYSHRTLSISTFNEVKLQKYIEQLPKSEWWKDFQKYVEYKTWPGSALSRDQVRTDTIWYYRDHFLSRKKTSAIAQYMDYSNSNDKRNFINSQAIPARFWYFYHFGMLLCIGHMSKEIDEKLINFDIFDKIHAAVADMLSKISIEK